MDSKKCLNVKKFCLSTRKCRVTYLPGGGGTKG